MISDVLLIIVAAYGFIGAIEITPVPGRLLNWIKTHKPFSCPLCLGFWFSLFVGMIVFNMCWEMSVLTGFIGAGSVRFIKLIEIKIAPLANINELEQRDKEVNHE